MEESKRGTYVFSGGRGRGGWWQIHGANSIPKLKALHSSNKPPRGSYNDFTEPAEHTRSQHQQNIR